MFVLQPAWQYWHDEREWCPRFRIGGKRRRTQVPHAVSAVQNDVVLFPIVLKNKKKINNKIKLASDIKLHSWNGKVITYYKM